MNAFGYDLDADFHCESSKVVDRCEKGAEFAHMNRLSGRHLSPMAIKNATLEAVDWPATDSA
jgi:hypothetical protein